MSEDFGMPDEWPPIQEKPGITIKVKTPVQSKPAAEPEPKKKVVRQPMSAELSAMRKIESLLASLKPEERSRVGNWVHSVTRIAAHEVVSHFIGETYNADD